MVHDPRRLARCEIDPDLGQLGPDALSLTRRQFDQVVHVVRGEGPAIKARLLDQSAVAGVGNLLGDEILFDAGIDPRTPTGLLDDLQRDRLFRSFTHTMRSLKKRGGSHLGAHMPGRFPTACARSTGRRCCRARWADAPPTGVRCTRSNPYLRQRFCGSTVFVSPLT